MAAAGADPLVRVTVRRLDARPGTGVALSFGAMLRRYDDDRLELVGADGRPLPRLRAEEQLVIERAVTNDAMYSQPARVARDVGTSETTAALRPDGEPQRTQQREFVRVETLPLPVHVRLTDGEDGEEPVRFEASLRDISAGGMRIAYTGDPLAAGRLAVLRFELTKEDGRPDPMEVRGEVRWGMPDIDEGRHVVGMRFTGVGRALETRLTGWVFREEAKRLRAARERP